MRTSSALLCLGLALASVVPARAGDAAARFHDLLAREWEWRLQQNPLFATAVGRNEYNHLLPNLAPPEIVRRAEATVAFLAELAAIDRAGLAGEDVVSYAMFERQLRDRLIDHELGDYQMPFNADSGFHTGFARLAEEVPLQTVRDYENYLARLAAWPRYVAQQIELMRLGLARGMTVPRAVLDGYEGTISAHLLDEPTKSVFWPPFERFPVGVPASERERLARQGKEAILTAAVAGYRAFLDFYLNEYLPKVRSTIAASDLPNGAAYYAHQVRQYTTLELGPEEIHRIGLAEVERIRREMEEVIRQVGFSGDFAAFLQHLRTEPRFYAGTPEELLKQAAWIVKRMDGKLPALFGRLPRLPYTVEPVPDHLAPKYTSGRYVEPPVGGTQPGIYWVNTFKLEARPLYNLEALSLHEAVPGHHLQNAIARELDGLPEFRRYAYLSAFGEGWGLYSEWLGLEAGFYTDPYSNFGRLTYEMWRACRLVVDTGLHAMGWSRQQAIDYLASRTALPLHEVGTETDRYISWPGQALSYKMGEIKIRELRRRAEAALGPRFDVREFHDVVLGSGSVPLTVLEENVERYLAGKAAAEKASAP